MISKKNLSNNITLVTQNDKSFATACIGFWFKAGSRFEDETNRGIAHFTEHLIFKGTESRNTQEISRIFDKMGGYINAFTERENVCLFCTIPTENPKNIQTALEVLCDISQNAVFPEEEFIREKTVVQNEINAILDDPEESALDVLAEKMWPNQKISKSITGSVEQVENLTVEMVKDWYKKYFVNGELSVYAAGNIDEEFLAEKLNLLMGKKGKLISSKQNHFDEKLKWQNGKFRIKAHFNQVQIFEAYNLNLPVTFKKFLAGSVFNAFAADSMSSRLFTEIREKNGICYSIYSFFTFYENAAVWCTGASCDKKMVKLLNQKMEEELKKLLTVEISDEEFENAVEHVCGEEIIGSEDCEYLMKRLEHYNSMGFELLDTKSICKGIRDLNKNDIICFMKELLKHDEKCVLYYGKCSRKLASV